MRANRRRDTRPELRVRSRLHRLGLRYRVDVPVGLAGGRWARPDIVFTRQRVAVFIDGCFWHGCPEHGRKPGGANDGYWTAKIARNRQRDAEQGRGLEIAGWVVLRFWEHEDPAAVVAAVAEALGRSGPGRAS